MTEEQQSLHKIEMHERECAIRYEYIEKSLNEGREKFKKLEIIFVTVIVILCFFP